MVTRIQKWGNSQGVRLVRQVLEDARMSVGEKVDVVARDGMIVIARLRRVRGRLNLKDLVAQLPRKYKAREMGWGKPVGREEW